MEKHFFLESNTHEYLQCVCFTTQRKSGLGAELIRIKYSRIVAIWDTQYTPINL